MRMRISETSRHTGADGGRSVEDVIEPAPDPLASLTEAEALIVGAGEEGERIARLVSFRAVMRRDDIQRLASLVLVQHTGRIEENEHTRTRYAFAFAFLSAFRFQLQARCEPLDLTVEEIRRLYWLETRDRAVELLAGRQASEAAVDALVDALDRSCSETIADHAPEAREAARVAREQDAQDARLGR